MIFKRVIKADTKGEENNSVIDLKKLTVESIFDEKIQQKFGDLSHQELANVLSLAISELVSNRPTKLVEGVLDGAIDLYKTRILNEFKGETGDKIISKTIRGTC
jgi:hypothetical protein